MPRKINYPDLLLLLASAVITILVALGVIRWLAPGLLGVPKDLTLVQSSKEVAPYYEHIFRREEIESDEFILNDPIIKVRAKPMFGDIGFMGPNDLLGFRNISVPVYADIVIIGDSQTYGNNAVIWENWPHLLQQYLPQGTSVYSMATGGWGAVQYYYALTRATIFQPEVIIIAFYTGNDPVETLTLAAASDTWKRFVPEGFDLNAYELIQAEFPLPETDQWAVKFPDGTATVFTPTVRHVSNKRLEVIDIAYEIMLNIAREMTRITSENDIKLIFTIIPSKEYAYSEKLRIFNIDYRSDYRELLSDETYRIESFSAALAALDGAQYIDVAEELKKKLVQPVQYYPEDLNGHPLADGYGIIAERIGAELKKYIAPVQNGLAIRRTTNDIQTPVYVSGEYFQVVTGDMERIKAELQTRGIKVIDARKLGGLIYRGRVSISDIPAWPDQE